MLRLTNTALLFILFTFLGIFWALLYYGAKYLPWICIGIGIHYGYVRWHERNRVKGPEDIIEAIRRVK